MNKILCAAGVVLIAAGLILFLLFGHHGGKAVQAGAITDPPSNFSYIQISQAIGWLTSGIATPINETVVRQTMVTTATTTICAILNPFSATSSVPYIAVNVTTGTSTLSTLNFATSTTAFATTSTFANYNIAANNQQTAVYTGTSTGQGPVVSPNGYLVIGATGGFTQGYVYGGSCSAKFISVN